MRLQMPTRVFAETAALLLPAPDDLALLVRIGVVRQGSENVELWSADTPLRDPIMQRLLRTSERMLGLWQTGCFQLCVDSCAIVLRYTDEFTFQALHLVLLVQGFPKQTYKLVWRRRELTAATGLLRDAGIGPGACLILKRNGVTQI